MRYKLFESDGGGNITVLTPDGDLLAADNTHPHWDAIVTGARTDDGSIFDLFDLGKTVEKNFQKVTERVSVRNGTIYLDGDEVDNVLTKKAIDFLEAGESDYLPLVKFFEKIQANPNQHSRDQAYEWLSRHGFALDDDGNVVAYKGVQRTTEDGVFQSGHQGHAIVNGTEVDGVVKYQVGDVVEMPRSEVQHDPTQGCHTGLHVGNYRYAKDFGQVLLNVSIDPRDIVSVPTDSNWEKVRVCRFKVVAVSDGNELGQRYYAGTEEDLEDEEDYDFEEEYCGDCGELDEDCICNDESCDCCGEVEAYCDCDENDDECAETSQFVVRSYKPKHF